MDEQRAPHLPAKGRLSWHILRLSLDAGGASWLATALKGGRVAVIRLPPLLEQSQEAAWLADIEARFESHAFDPLLAEYPGGPARCRLARAGRGHLEPLSLNGSSVYDPTHGDERVLVGQGAAAALEKARSQR